MSAAGKRVLVTGIGGFTGRCLQAELQAHGHRVIGTGSAPEVGADYYQVDLLDAAQLKDVLAHVRPDVVVHLAALAFVAHGDADDFYQVNLIGTRHLLDAIVASGKPPQCVLLASSANVYGNRSEGLLDEATLPAPANDYAVSKLAMEYMAQLWRDKLPLVIARPFNYTGVGQSRNFLIPKIVEHFRLKADVIELGNLEVSREFNDVRTVAYIYRRLIETPRAIGQTVNVSSGKAWSLREVVTLCEELTGRRIELKVNSAFVRANEVKVLCGDNTRLRGFIGEWPSPSLRDTLEWMLTN